MKLLTIIVPSYNMERYLPKCLGSLLVKEELLNLIEVIIVNDGSTDATSAIAHDFERQYPAVFRVVDKENGNHGSCVNRGLKETSGVFVRVLDADDSFDTKVFEDFLIYLREIESKYPEAVDAFISDFIRVDPEGTALDYSDYGYPRNRIFDLSEIIESNKKQNMAALWYRTSLLKKIKYHQTEKISYSDNEWRIEPFVAIRKMAYFPQNVYRYLIGRPGQSMELSIWRRNGAMLFQIADKILEFYKVHQMEIESSNKRFIHYELEFLFILIYGLYALYMPLPEAYVKLREMDEKLKNDFTDIYNKLNGLSICDRYCPIYYLRLIRSHPHYAISIMRCVRGFNSVYNFIAKLLGRRTAK